MLLIPIKDENPTVRPPVVTVSIIVACVAVFLYQLTMPEPVQERFIFRFGMIPALLLDDAVGAKHIGIPPWATIFTSMFLHGGFAHIAGNMLFLWIFGNNIEDALGHVRFVLFYVLTGVAAAMAQAVVDPHSTLPMVGASGAISGVLGAYLVLHPQARVTLLFWIFVFVRTFEAPAYAVLGLWFGFQVVNGLLADPAEGGVAFFAHIGGFVAGAALIWLFRPGTVRVVGPPPRRGPWG
jgi:membrane associated rhomboid family serine protease